MDNLELALKIKESLLSDLSGQLAVKDIENAHMVLDRRQSNDALKKMKLKKDRLIARLYDDIADLKRREQQQEHPDLPTLDPLVPDTKFQGVYQPSDRPDMYVYILGRTWTLDSLRTSQCSPSAPNRMFYWAAHNGVAEAVRHIYDTTSVDEMYVDPKTKMNALQVASRQNFSSVVKTLLSLGLTSGHHQALRLAVDRGHLEIVRMLRVSGARLSVLPLSAVQNGYEEIVKILICDNVDISDPGLLECAVINRHNEIVKTLSSKDHPSGKSQMECDPGYIDSKTDLETASFNGDTTELQNLLRLTPHTYSLEILVNSFYYATCKLQGPCLRILLDYLVRRVDGRTVFAYIGFQKALKLAVCMGNDKILGVLRKTEQKGKLSPDVQDQGESRLIDLQKIIRSEQARSRSALPSSSPRLERVLEDETGTPGEGATI